MEVLGSVGGADMQMPDLTIFGGVVTKYKNAGKRLVERYLKSEIRI